MLSEDEGIKAIIALQAIAGIVETEEQAKTEWNNMSDVEKRKTERYHQMIERKKKGGQNEN